MSRSPAAIMVVDDSPSKRYVIASWLRRAGYGVVEAQTGREALRRLEDTPVDLVVLDVRLPDMSGFAVCGLIKGDPAHAATPVIHVSAAAIETVDRNQGIASGADAYLVEPIDPGELLGTVHAILRYYRGRQQAELLVARLSMLARVTARLNEAKTGVELLREAATGTAAIFQAPSAVATEEAASGWLVATCEAADAAAIVRPWLPAPGLPPPGQEVDLPADRLGIASWLDSGGARVASASARPSRGPVHVAVPAEAAAPGGPVLTLVAQAVAGAFEIQRTFAVEHHLALTLQHSLLPQHLPAIEGIELAKRYLPASDVAEIGGDFYELSELDGLVVVAVGDVGGHSLHAATVMAELRHAMRAYLVEGTGPAEVLGRLNRMMLRLLPREIATVCLLTLDPRTGGIRLANAGHPPPLLIHDGTVRRLTEHDPLLGLRTSGLGEQSLHLPAGATLVLYTDGLIERRSEPIDAGLDRLSAAATRPDADLEVFCDRLIRDVGPTERLDDIALVAIRRR